MAQKTLATILLVVFGVTSVTAPTRAATQPGSDCQFAPASLAGLSCRVDPCVYTDILGPANFCLGEIPLSITGTACGDYVTLQLGIQSNAICWQVVEAPPNALALLSPPIKTLCAPLNTVCSTSIATASVICGSFAATADILVHYCGGAATAGGSGASPNPYKALVEWNGHGCGSSAKNGCSAEKGKEMTGVCAWSCGTTQTTAVGKEMCARFVSLQVGCTEAAYYTEVVSKATAHSFIDENVAGMWVQIGPIETIVSNSYDSAYGRG
jgi:hypothetical protein